MSSFKTLLPSRLHTGFFLLVLLTHRNSHNSGRQQQQQGRHGGSGWSSSSSSSIGLAHAAPKRRKDGNPLSRSISVHNKAAAKIDLFWIHPTTQELAPSNTNGDGIVFGAMTGVLSYVSHRFEVQEIPNPTTGRCKYSECRKAYFACSEQENQEIDIVTDLLNPAGDFLVQIDDDKLKAEREAMRALEPCQAKVADMADPKQKLAALAACWKTQTDNKLAATQDEIAFQKVVRNRLGAKLQQYKCDAAYDGTVNMTTSESQFNSTFFAPEANKQVELLFESDYSSVQLYREFLTPTECQAIMIGQSVAASDSALQKIRRLALELMSQDPYRTSTKSIRWRIDNGDLNKAAADDGKQECIVQADGSCVANDNNATTARTSSSSSSSLMRVTQTDASVVARLLVTCTSSTAAVKGGILFYPKAGVQIVPVSGEAVVTVYQDQRGQRDDDPFVDDHIVCPVQTGVVVTLEDIYYAAAH